VGCNEACGYDQATKDAIDALGDADILNVFAAGNSGTNNDVTPFYPASYTSPSILAVAASDSNDNRRFSFGVASVDLAAPGVVILSTGGASDSHYTHMSGTSMATPHVAGAAALLAAQHPSLSAASLKATLINTVDVITAPTDWRTLVRSGGRLNVANALQNPTVCNIAPETDTLLAPTKGGIVSIAVSAPANCDYSVKSSANWVVLQSASEMSGNGILRFWVRFNTTIRRTATIRVGDRQVVVVQSRDGSL